VAYNGKVYDLTAFLPKHPGSAAAIIPYCGTSEEFKAAFSDQHGTSQVNKMIEESILKGDL
jgi:cytochrome b involved in lipid metabolism